MSTLLLADSDINVRTTLARSLAGYGFAVIATANAQEAIGVLKSRDVDLLVTELALPVTDGFALLEYARQHQPNVPTVVLTALAPADAAGRLGEPAPARVLYKPITVKALAREAREALSERVRGSVSGITLPSLLQMLEWERKTCSVRATSDAGRGRLDFAAGTLVNAYSYSSRAEGEAAAYEIFAWDDPRLELERTHPATRHLIDTPLQNLLIDAMRRKDERSRQLPPETDDAVLVGETEDEMFFRWNRRQSAPPVEVAPPPRAAATPEPPAPDALTVTASVPASAEARAPHTAVMTAVQPVTSGGAPAANEQTTADGAAAHTSDTLKTFLGGVDGALAALLVDYRSGVTLGRAGGGVNLEVAAVGNSRVVRAKLRTMAALGLDEELEDILITLSSQYHLLRVVPGRELFLYLVLGRKANLARSRHKLKGLADALSA